MSTPLHATWLGSWKVPVDLGLGRRWGDRTWALAALAQAWMLGGAEGRWPCATWQAKRPRGPWMAEIPERWESHPDPAWVALLRHGSSNLPAQHRNPREDELLAWCWEALLKGDGAPWMAYGSVLLDRKARLRWIAALGAVDADGCLVLPPFLADFVPEAMRILPPGWWACLLGTQDSRGRLLPEGTLPSGLPWDLLLGPLAPLLEPLRMDSLPEALHAFRHESWMHQLQDGTWMVDPRLRAWARGWGACPESLEALVPSTLALGGRPSSLIDAVLQSKLPEAASLPKLWIDALKDDLEFVRVSQLPEACGEPTLDRIRVRWGGSLPEPASGYPAWGERAHPCADPFHWMAEGNRVYHAQDMESALRAFTWAHAHFLRLGAERWACRAASNAALTALFWGDLPALSAWIRAAGPQPSPLDEMDELVFLNARAEWEEADRRLSKLLERHPEQPSLWATLALRGLATQRREWMERALPHLPSESLRLLTEAALGELREAPPDELGPEDLLLWELHRVLRGHVEAKAFWCAWEQCHNQPTRLESALTILEAKPAERTLEHLLPLQSIVDRMASPIHQRRLKVLWPTSNEHVSMKPAEILHHWLSQRREPGWILWGDEGCLGVGEAPPEGALGRLRQEGSLAPFRHGPWIWWSVPLRWEDARVGSALLALQPSATAEEAAGAQLLAPWVSQLVSKEKPVFPVESGDLLTDGSEPLASVLRELVRVAPSELPVLILGPTGSGKELCAREIHQRSGRQGSLVPVNCSAFAEGVLESELFGHVKGAFTSADRDRRGAIEMADKGTLFLDEVADMSARSQSMFLRVLQEREVRRVGSERAHKVDVRFLAATHKSLDQLIAQGTFRRDLLFRLQGTVLTLPSLRERRHEFPYLLPRLVHQIATQNRRETPAIAPGLAQSLSRLPWPGNFRELRHAIERALLRCEEGLLKAEHFPELQIPVVQERGWTEATHTFQRKLLLDTLQQHRFHAAETARTLGLTRPALYLAAKRLGLDLVKERMQWEGGDTQGSA